MTGQTICRKHGGKAGQNLAAGERRVAQAEASAVVTRLLHDTNAAPVDDPVGELQAVVGRMGHAADVLGEQVNALKRVDYTDANSVRRLHVLVEAWSGLTVEYRRALTDMAKLGIAERQVRLAEHQGELLAGVLERFAAALLGASVAALRDHGDAAQVLRALWPAASAEYGQRELLAAIEAPPREGRP